MADENKIGLAEIREAFLLFDNDKDDKVTLNGAWNTCRATGLVVDEKQVAAVLKEMGLDAVELATFKSVVTFDNVVALVAALPRPDTPEIVIRDRPDPRLVEDLEKPSRLR